MAKPVPQYVLNTRAANKILNILANETYANRAAILGFVTSSVGDLPAVEGQAQDARQAPLPFTGEATPS